MASDIFSVRPPEWIQSLTTPSEPGMVGKILGELVGGTAIAAQQAQGDVEKAQAEGKPETWTGAWLKAIPRGIQESGLNVSDPMWRLKAQQAQLGMAHTALGIQLQQQEIDSNKVKADMLAKDQETGPQWMRDHPTLESRIGAEDPVLLTPEWNRNFDQLRLRDSQSVQTKLVVSGVKQFSDRLATLAKTDAEGAAQIAGAAAQYTGRGQMPPAAITGALATAEEAATQRAQNQLMQQQVTQEAAVQKGKEEGATIKSVFGPKGETVSITSGGAADTNRARVGTEMTTPSGIHAVWVGPNQIRLTEGGKTKDLTTSQLLSVAKSLPIYDKNRKSIEDFMSGKAMGQITNAPAATAVPAKPSATAPTANPYQLGGIYRSGDKKMKYLGGDWNDEKNWQVLP